MDEHHGVSVGLAAGFGAAKAPEAEDLLVAAPATTVEGETAVVGVIAPAFDPLAPVEVQVPVVEPIPEPGAVLEVKEPETPAPVAEPAAPLSPFTQETNDLRRHVKVLAHAVKETKFAHALAPVDPVEDRGEVQANLMLAYRHLEDASMRLGKAIQAADGGASVYDRATTVGA